MVPASCRTDVPTLLSHVTSISVPPSPHYFTEVLTLACIKSSLLHHDRYFNSFGFYPSMFRCLCELWLQLLYVFLALSNLTEWLYLKVAFCLQKGIIFLKACSVLLELDPVFPPHQKCPLHECNCFLELSSGTFSAQNSIVTPPRAAFLEVGSGKILRLRCVKCHFGSNVSSTGHTIAIRTGLGRHDLIFKI